VCRWGSSSGSDVDWVQDTQYTTHDPINARTITPLTAYLRATASTNQPRRRMSRTDID